MTLSIVDARSEHTSFVAWVLLTSHRSHLPEGMWDFLVGDRTEDTLAFLEALAGSPEPHFAHYSRFIVAEVEGRPAAALCGYFEEQDGMPALEKGMDEAHRRSGRSPGEIAAGNRRVAPIMHVAPSHEAGAWIVEHVATDPEFRRRGLVAALLEQILDRGRARGARVADIGILIGNDPAQRAYERSGFKVIGERRHPDFEALWGCPGIRSLSRPL